ncbi:carboxymuconolactone decarboxylase family protein [Leifsonia sp. 2MCAF36]|uniref:carboxymuconolactone decarboxylase family protein n=1 Tax=Leifsonia sp. 2MCAF36 TaxID=3232988 RepID=UPI003F983C5E
MSDEQAGWTGGQRAFGDFAPGFVHYTDRVLFDEVWERPELSKRDRSLITVTALLVGGNIDQLRFHIPFARENGVTEQGLIEAITHLAFYAQDVGKAFRPVPPFLAEPLARLREGKEPDDLLFADRFGGFLRRPAPATTSAPGS